MCAFESVVCFEILFGGGFCLVIGDFVRRSF